MNAQYVKKEEIPESVIAKQKEIFEAQLKEEGKPQQAWPKINEGKMNGFYKSVVLLEQSFVKDNKQTIESVVKSLGPEAHVRGKKFSGSLRRRGSRPGSGSTDSTPSWSGQET